jgi:hypothetical protein
MKREDYMFCIGYQGNSAVIDGQARKNFSKASVTQLIEAGLFRAAFCAAVYDNDDDALQEVLQSYNKLSGAALSNREDAMKLWGAVLPSNAVEKTVVIK